MLGLMQKMPLLVSSILVHAARHHGGAEVVSRLEDGRVVRASYREVEARARRLAGALAGLGVQGGDRVATLAWNSQWHVEAYYAISGMGAVTHTVNPRLSVADIVHILNDAGSVAVFADAGFAALLREVLPGVPGVRHVVVMGGGAEVLEGVGAAVHGFEALVEAGVDSGFEWPGLDEDQASALCYTSGTTGRPKGVLYSHRSTMIHAYAINMADVFGLRAADRVMPVVPMFHVNAWGLPYAAPMAGASLVMPGRQLDGASVVGLMNAEGVTFSAGVPTVWMGVLQHLRDSGGSVPTLKRLVCGGSAAPPALIDGFRAFGVSMDHAWGMTETSPLGTVYAPSPATEALPAEARDRLRYTQGRAIAGIDMRIVDEARAALPWDGETFGNLEVRGHWVTRRYVNAGADACDAEGWFATGDVATITPEGMMQITDRTKDIVKSGGEWISSIQLENIAVGHPDVAEAAIVAARHPKWDERPLLIIVAKEEVAKEGRVVDPASVLATYAGKVAKWWVPDEVVVVDALPHTATGKLNKLALRQQFKDFRLASVGE